jgi:hypothetical protein
MQISYLRSYTSKNGNKTFVYAVSGTEAQLSAFKSAMADNYRTDDESGEPLWFTTRSVGPKAKLIITKNNKVVPDMSAFDQAASLAKQYGGNLGTELARIAAQALTGSLPQGTTEPQAQAKSSDNIDDL